MVKCCFYCGKLFRAKQRLRGAFVLLRAFLTDCLRPLCMLGLFMSLADAAVRMPRARDRPEICHNLPLLLRCLKHKDPTKRVIQPHDRNNTFRNLNSKTDAFCLTQPSRTHLTAEPRVVMVLWIHSHLHFQCPALRLFLFSVFPPFHRLSESVLPSASSL